MSQMVDNPVQVTAWQRWLLPSGSLTRTSDARTPRDWFVDVSMILFAGGLGAGIRFEVMPDRTIWVGLDVLLGFIACGLLLWRRQHPARVAIAIFVLAAVSLSAGGALLAALFNAGIRVRGRNLSWLSGGALTAMYTSSILDNTQITLIDFIGPPGAVAVLVSWGLFVRVQRDLVTTLHAQAARAVEDRIADQERTRDGERRRIAREMHDVLAHRISMLGLHAGALEYRGASATTEEISEAAGVIRASAAAAMRELGEVIGVLREPEVDAPAGISPPQPTLARIPELIADCRAAGMHVDADIAHVGKRGPAAVELAAYRVVQEGLTNAGRHAPGSRVRVRIAYVDDSIQVEVLTRANVRMQGLHATDTRGSGAGLIGLLERVELVEGALEHGFDEAGDFRLAATLPWTA